MPLALLAGCASSAPLGEQIEQGVAAAGDSFSLAEVASVEGTSFLVLCPYDSEESVNERLGFVWSGSPDLSRDDSRQTIAVVDDGAVVQSAELSRGSVDLCAGEPWELQPVTAVLPVTVEDGVAVVSAP